MKRLFVALVVVMAMAVVIPASAQEGPPPGERAREAVATFLGLSPEQVSAWEGLLEDREAAARPIVEEMRATGAELRELLGSEDPDACEVGALVLTERTLRGDLRDVHQAYVAAFEALLDEEQAQRLGFIRRAERVQPLLPAFRVFGLLAPPPEGPEDPGQLALGGLL